MKNPLVSIHIITYNQIDFIHETLLSALEQDYDNLEVVVADDGSTDGTADIILEYTQKYPGRLVPLVGGTNLGITGNSNRGLAQCKGKYIAFQGGDDVLLPSKIKAQVEWLEKDEKRVLCGHQTEVFYQDNRRPPHLFTKNIKKIKGLGPGFVIRNGQAFFAGTSIMIRASKVPPGGFNENIRTVSDYLFWIDVLSDGGEFGSIEGIYARYRRHASNATKNWYKTVCEVENVIHIVSEKYPHYIFDCNYALIKNNYMYGMCARISGDMKTARKKLLRVIRYKPLWIDAWLQLLLSYIPFSNSLTRIKHKLEWSINRKKNEPKR